MTFGALSDITVLDLTQMLAGPYGSMMLADQGANVIKIESVTGDLCRQVKAFPKGDETQTHNGYFQSINRNKKSIVLDLKSEEGKAAFLELVKTADAVMENFNVGVMDRLGLGYETLKVVNPKIVYGSLTGFGNPRGGESPYAKWPAFDIVAQAMGGIVGITGPDAETPTKIGPGIGDIVPGMHLAFGVLSAIHHARATGQGQYVDVAMADSVLALSERIVYQQSYLNINPKPDGNHHPFNTPFGIFPATDGAVAIAAMLDHHFKILCEELDADSLLEDERYTDVFKRGEHRVALIEDLNAVTARFSREEMKSRLGGKIPFSLVMEGQDIMQDPHFAAREMIVDIEQPGVDQSMQIAGVPVKLTETPGGVHSRSPFLGEHTGDIVAGLNLADDIKAKIITKP